MMAGNKQINIRQTDDYDYKTSYQYFIQKVPQAAQKSRLSRLRSSVRLCGRAPQYHHRSRKRLPYHQESRPVIDIPQNTPVAHTRDCTLRRVGRNRAPLLNHLSQQKVIESIGSHKNAQTDPLGAFKKYFIARLNHSMRDLSD